MNVFVLDDIKESAVGASIGAAFASCPDPMTPQIQRVYCDENGKPLNIIHSNLQGVHLSNEDVERIKIELKEDALIEPVFYNKNRKERREKQRQFKGKKKYGW